MRHDVNAIASISRPKRGAASSENRKRIGDRLFKGDRRKPPVFLSSFPDRARRRFLAFIALLNQRFF